MNSQRSVLIVDPSEETREVLQTVLERHGVRTLAADKAQKGLELAHQHRPDLIVLDLELDMPAEQFATAPSAVASDEATAINLPAFSDIHAPYEPRLVLLGNLRGRSGLPSQGEFVAKPYHYGLLIRRIEELLQRHENWAGESASCRRSSSSAEPTRAAASN